MGQLERTIELYKAMENPKWQGVYIYGSIEVTDVLKSFVNDYSDDLEIELENAQGSIINNDDIGQYENLQIKFLPPRKEFAFFAKDFEDYLSNFSFIYEPANQFYISGGDGFYDEGETSNKHIEAYCKIIELYKLLLKVADHTEKDDATAHRHIILSASGKDDILVSYDNEDIVKLSDKLETFNINGIEEALFSTPHKDAKLSLFKKSISQYLLGSKDELKFSTLIGCLPEIVKNFKNNYELFLQEFSFEDEKEKLEQKKQEYLIKLNEILSGVHSKLLAVPVSLVIVAGQMRSSEDQNFLLINFIVLSGAFIFACLMWMLTGNQLHSLSAVEIEYLSKKKRLQMELRNGLYDELDEAFKQLDKRFKHQRRMIRLVDYLVLLGLFLSAFVFEYHTGYIASLL